MGNLLPKGKRQPREVHTKQMATPVDFELISFKYPWHHLVIEGGGTKVVACAGTLKVLEITGALNNMTKFAGTSAGSIVVLALVLGYTVDEIIKLLIQSDFSDLMSTMSASSFIGDSTRLIKSFGLSDGSNLLDFITRLITERQHKEDITFYELYNITKKELVVTGCNVNTGKTEFFSHMMSPNMEVRQGIRISTAIPFIFTPVKTNLDSDLFVDGGLFHNYPLGAFDGGDGSDIEKLKTIGLKFINTASSFPRRDITNILSFGVAIVSDLMNEIETLRAKADDDYWRRTIPINVGSINSTDLTLDNATKRMLYDSGVKAANQFLTKWVKANRRRNSWFKTIKGVGSRRNSDAILKAAQNLRTLINKANKTNRENSGVFRSIGEIMVPNATSSIRGGNGSNKRY